MMDEIQEKLVRYYGAVEVAKRFRPYDEKTMSLSEHNAAENNVIEAYEELKATLKEYGGL